MNFALVNIRLKQISQESGGLGPLYLLLIIALIGWGGYALFLYYQDLDKALFIEGLIFFSVFNIHLIRKDSRFVWHQLTQPKNKLFTEYLCFTLPFLAPAIATWQFWLLPLHILLLGLLVQWRFFRKRRYYYLPGIARIFPAAAFEWISGMRKMGIPILILYLISWVFCWLRGFPIISLWFVTLLLTTFYTEGESKIILRLHCKRPGAFLWWKIGLHSRIFLVIYLPLLAVNASFHPDIWYFHLLFLCLQWVALIMMITMKYSAYIPNEKIKANSIILSMALIGTIFPYLAPLPIFLCFWFFRKALIRLRPYNSG